MYSFNEQEVFNKISEDWKKFAESIHTDKIIVGISGGIDSTCVAALACRIFGRENVIGISMPCDEQKDIIDVLFAFNHLGIRKMDLNIGDAFHSIVDGIENNAVEASSQTKTNLPARLRMSVLYAFAQSLNGMVVNTCNLSEDDAGWNTFGGDNIGSYAPVRYLTKTEVRKLAAWLGVPRQLVMKTPIDGLQAKTDEENFGFTYDALDTYIRTGVGDFSLVGSITTMYRKNKFKLDIIDLPGPDFGFPDYVQEKNIEEV